MSITLTELARLTGVSKATVSRVINNKSGVGEETRRRIKQAIEELSDGGGVQPRSRIRSKCLGLILPDITNPFFSQLALEIGSTCKEYSYSVMLGNTDFSTDRECDYIKTFISKRVDGVILVSTCRRAQQGHELLKKYDIPCVLLDRVVDGVQSFARVLNDNYYASYSCCDRLIRSGSRDIVFIAGDTHVSTSLERVEGYRFALEHHGIPYRPELVCHGGYTIEGGYNAVIGLAQAGLRFSSVMAANDMMAFGAMKALKKLGCRIPEDVQIVGFDNIFFAQYMEPQLSTVQQPTSEMGRRAAELMIRYLSGDERVKAELTGTVRLQPAILERATTLWGCRES